MRIVDQVYRDMLPSELDLDEIETAQVPPRSDPPNRNVMTCRRLVIGSQSTKT